MKWTLPFGALTASSAWLAASGVIACSIALPSPFMSAAEAEADYARRVLSAQVGNWEGAESVFLARVNTLRSIETSPTSSEGLVVLVPVLQLKGPKVRTNITVRQSLGICGMQPDFRAFKEGSDGYYLIYSADHRRVAQGTFAIHPVETLIDRTTLAAWSEAYGNVDR